jgi:hypothetical protein
MLPGRKSASRSLAGTRQRNLRRPRARSQNGSGQPRQSRRNTWSGHFCFFQNMTSLGPISFFSTTRTSRKFTALQASLATGGQNRPFMPSHISRRLSLTTGSGAWWTRYREGSLCMSMSTVTTRRGGSGQFGHRRETANEGPSNSGPKE